MFNNCNQTRHDQYFACFLIRTYILLKENQCRENIALMLYLNIRGLHMQQASRANNLASIAYVL